MATTTKTPNNPTPTLTTAAAAPRAFCYTCFKPQEACVCSLVPTIANRTRVLILQHPRERFHPLGTVRLARLALANLRIAIFGEQFAHQASWLHEPLPPRTAVLFPGPDARPLGELAGDERPEALVVLDGTWPNARKMLPRHPALAALPRVSLMPQAPSLYRIRAEPAPHCRSTIEAIAEALTILEPDTAGLPGLVAALTGMVDAHLALRAARPAVSFHRQRRPRPARSLPEALLHPERLVVVYGEYTRRDDAFHPVYWAAQRVGDGARFAALIDAGPGRGRPEAKQLEQMGFAGVPEGWPGRPVAAVQRDFEAFLRASDVLAAWNQSTLDFYDEVLAPPLATPRRDRVLLKAAYCNHVGKATGRSAGRRCGELAEIITHHGLELPRGDFLGRAATRMAEALAITRLLCDGLRTAPRR